MSITISGSDLRIEDLYEVAHGRERVELAIDAERQVEDCYVRLGTWGEAMYPIYGVNTGFGEMVTSLVPPSEARALQKNLIRSHAAGGGDALPEEVVRAIMLARLNTLMCGYSGVSTRTVHLIRDFINMGVCPYVPSQGSLGASGDLAPLAHIALALIGEGEIFENGRRQPALQVITQLGLEPLDPTFKEGLALINGTSGMTGLACLSVKHANNLLGHAVALSALFVQCLKASSKPFDERGNSLKLHDGQHVIASIIRDYIEGGRHARSHTDIYSVMTGQTRSDVIVHTSTYLQNAYTSRAIPQILGPVYTSIDACKDVFYKELNSVDDNPLFFGKPEETFHGAHFHGQYVAMYSDFLSVSVAEIGVLAERQVNRLLDPNLNGDLPDFLTGSDRGLYSGLAGLQYLATSIAAENIDMATPASLKSLPSNGSNQDVVSMGLIAARKTAGIIENVSRVLSVLAVAVVQASVFIGRDGFGDMSRCYLDYITSLLDYKALPYTDDVPVYTLVEKIHQQLMLHPPLDWIE